MERSTSGHMDNNNQVTTEKDEPSMPRDVTFLTGFWNGVCLFEPLMKSRPSLRVYDLESGVNIMHEGLDAHDVFPLSMFFGHCLTDEDLRLAVKDGDFMFRITHFIKRAAKQHIEERTAVEIRAQYEEVDTFLFGDVEDHGSDLAVKRASEELLMRYEELVEESMNGELVI